MKKFSVNLYTSDGVFVSQHNFETRKEVNVFIQLIDHLYQYKIFES